MARGADEARRRLALEVLCHSYWYPLYAFLRRSGRNTEDAEDLVQEFFARLMDGRLLNGAEPAKGKFRTLLLAALKNLDADTRKAANAEKRGGRVRFVELDILDAEERWKSHEHEAVSSETTFDRAWALAVMDRAGQRLREEYADKGELLAALMPRLTGDAGDAGLAEIGRGLGMTEAAVKMSLSRMRRRYAEALRWEVAQMVGSREEVREEVGYLMGAFS